MFDFPDLVFTSPKKLPDVSKIKGNVIVLDVAFSAKGLKPAFEDVTLPFIEELGDRLIYWIDHHDHEYMEEYNKDSRFILSTKQEHPACPEMITPELVEKAGVIGTIVCHLDLDGLYSAAKWINGGYEPYVGADNHARIADSRIGELTEPALTIDHALRGRFRDYDLKIQIIKYLISEDKSVYWYHIKKAAEEYAALARNAALLAEQYKVEDNVAYLKIKNKTKPFDKTELLLLGQKLAKVAIVEHAGNITFAADFNSGIDFVELFELGGGMPTRVSVPIKYAKGYISKLKHHLD